MEKFIRPDPVNELSLVARGRPAVKRLRKAMLALDPKQLRPLNIDIPLAVSRALGVLPAVFTLRERMTRDCAAADLKAIDELEDRALATATIHGDLETASSMPVSFQAVVDEAFESRAGLLSVLRMLVALNYLNEESLSSFNGGHGYRDTADDLIAMVGLLNRNWAAIDGKVPMTQANLDRFQALAEKVLAMVGEREQAPGRTDEASDLRARAFTLLDEAYDEFRRVVTFLRWREGDADDIAPPLRVRVPGRRPTDKPADEAGRADVTKADASKDSTGKDATGKDSSGKDATESSAKPQAPVVAPAVPLGPAPSGLPRNNPFIT